MNKKFSTLLMGGLLLPVRLLHKLRLRLKELQHKRL